MVLQAVRATAAWCSSQPKGDPRPGEEANNENTTTTAATELARHPLSVLWLAANVKRPEHARAVHEWSAARRGAGRRRRAA